MTCRARLDHRRNGWLRDQVAGAAGIAWEPITGEFFTRDVPKHVNHTYYIHKVGIGAGTHTYIQSAVVILSFLLLSAFATYFFDSGETKFLK